MLGLDVRLVGLLWIEQTKLELRYIGGWICIIGV